MANDSVSYGRTVSRNYQSERAEVTLQVVDGWSVHEVYSLARYMVESMLGIRCKDRRHANELLRAYYADDNADIDDYSRDSAV